MNYHFNYYDVKSSRLYADSQRLVAAYKRALNEKAWKTGTMPMESSPLYILPTCLKLLHSPQNTKLMKWLMFACLRFSAVVEVSGTEHGSPAKPRGRTTDLSGSQAIKE
jgi:hypothetical protein